jgi:YVTN family beta-propeller protein
VPASTDPRIGSELLGYRIESLLGRGGMGVVYKADDPRLKRHVALKLVAPELSGDERFRERFLRESELAASLEHPNVIPIHDAREVDGQLVIAMRLVEGTDLKTLLQTEGPLEPGRALAICAQVGAALDTAHTRGLVHRDVKPSNVLLDEREHVYLADFGLTRQATEHNLTGEEALSLGTAAYASPEQIEGSGVDGRADLYALGCVLYESLTGEPPFHHHSELALLWAHMQEHPPRASERNPELPEAIDAVLERALAKEPGERFASCAELVDTARQALGLHQPVVIRDRKTLLVIAVGLAIAAAALLAGLLLSQSGGGSPRASTKPTPTPRVDSLQRLSPRTGELVATTPVGHNPRAVAVGEGAVWVGSVEDSAVLRLDPATNQVAPVATTGGPDAIAVGNGSVWVVNRDGTLTKIDPATLAPTSSPGSGYLAVAVGENALWTLGPDGLVRINRGGDVVRTIKRVCCYAVATGFGGVWAVDDSGVWHVDARTNRIVSRIPIRDPGGLAVGAGGVWVTSNPLDRLFEIDPATNRVVHSIRVGGRPLGVAVGGGAVWVANYKDGTVSRVDPQSRTVVSTKVGRYPTSIAAGVGGVWVTVRAD